MIMSPLKTAIALAIATLAASGAWALPPQTCDPTVAGCGGATFPNIQPLPPIKDRNLDPDRLHPVTVKDTPNPPLCKQGFVWRTARPSDLVCVVPQTRAETKAENAAAAANRSPNGGAYGPNTCKPGLVWRNAFDGDAVCVIPKSRDRARADNAAAASRIAR